MKTRCSLTAKDIKKISMDQKRTTKQKKEEKKEKRKSSLVMFLNHFKPQMREHAKTEPSGSPRIQEENDFFETLKAKMLNATPTDVVREFMKNEPKGENKGVQIFHIKDYPTQINMFRVMGEYHVQVVDKDLYVDSLEQVVKLLSLVTNKTFSQQILFYQEKYSPFEILSCLMENVITALDDNLKSKNEEAIHCINILIAWLEVRGTVFTDNKLLFYVMDFYKALKSVEKKFPFLLSCLNDLNEAIKVVFEENGVVTFAKKRIVDENLFKFQEVCVSDKECRERLPEQLSGIELMLLGKITPHEYYLYFNATTRPVSLVNQYSQWSCLFSRWISYEIVRVKDLEKRKVALLGCLTLATDCLKYKNFNSAISILNGLEHQAVRRLNNTWNLLEKKDWNIFCELKDVVLEEKAQNFSVTFRPPSVPNFEHQIEIMQEIYNSPDIYRDVDGEKVQMLNVVKCSKIGAIIDLLGVYASNVPEKENKQIVEFFTTKLLNLPLNDDSLLGLSLSAEIPK
ncbi:hypothetical protein EIN_253540 [Entamoeba invadens IP1]|uniref:Ras-GEF domain-containing protein n=1 Tax=Entamoeba invadens IP1 TaxID=370355 RepID=A0A0A1UET6_ENTIV|nr:hypothetical protein EIN_253540 [Entamoeba invadens IP1]ELP95080.1 hypothetical protein EIN_253540 [Entamoeba invadens IP1]|eukprot:XP_004261851.1 hypothetical protein EIN_253540 [Entamoeba invadens IP1]